MIRFGLIPPRAIRRILFVGIAMSVLAACRAGIGAPTSSPSGGSDGELGRTSFTTRLEHAIRDGWERGQLLVECHRDGRLQSVEIFASGLGVWEGSRQFRLSPEQVREILVTLRDDGFAAMDEVYGGVARMDPEKQGFAVVCRVAVDLDGVAREVVQRRRGVQEEPLRKLALSILSACQEPGQAGLAAGSLAHGFEMLEEGALELETWNLLFHRKPGPADSDAEGWLLRVDGYRMTTQAFRGSSGYGPEISRELDDRDTALLLEALAAADLESMPANVWAGEYTDLVVQVLDQRVGIQARAFSGMDQSTHGEAQVRFDGVFAYLHALHVEMVQEAVATEK